MKPATMVDVVFNGELDGYRAVAPSPGDCARFDREEIERLACRECGWAGLRYRPYTRPGSYRAFGECPACGVVEEL